ncbi:hypothetical protein THAOC_05520, partial [Thalassiosira oceanica]
VGGQGVNDEVPVGVETGRVGPEPRNLGRGEEVGYHGDPAAFDRSDGRFGQNRERRRGGGEQQRRCHNRDGHGGAAAGTDRDQLAIQPDPTPNATPTGTAPTATPKPNAKRK